MRRKILSALASLAAAVTVFSFAVIPAQAMGYANNYGNNYNNNNYGNNVRVSTDFNYEAYVRASYHQYYEANNYGNNYGNYGNYGGYNHNPCYNSCNYCNRY